MRSLSLSDLYLKPKWEAKNPEAIITELWLQSVNYALHTWIICLILLCCTTKPKLNCTVIAAAAALKVKQIILPISVVFSCPKCDGIESGMVHFLLVRLCWCNDFSVYFFHHAITLQNITNNLKNYSSARMPLILFV